MPDSRIEKMALIMKNKGHETIFLGAGPIRGEGLNAFSDTHYVPIPNSLMLVLRSKFQNEWIKRIELIKPDIVHAHNIIVAAIMLDTDYPVIYDDHEYWSKMAFKFEQRPLIRRIASLPLKKMIPKWEHSVVSKYPVITTHPNIAVEHRRISNHVAVVRNYTSIKEVEGLQQNQDRDGVVYIGNDFLKERFVPHRDMSGIKNYVNIECIYGMTHRQMMEELTKYKVGIIPWKPHPHHKYSNPNKAYEYQHAGLQVVLTHTLSDEFVGVPHVHPFHHYEEIPEILNTLPDYSPEDISDYARKHCLWENQIPLIEETYEKAI